MTEKDKRVMRILEKAREPQEPDSTNFLGNRNGFGQGFAQSVFGVGGVSATVTARADHINEIVEETSVIRKYGIYDKEDQKHQAGSVYDQEGLSPNIDTGGGGNHQPIIEEEKKQFRIRKLTPRECWRLMGFTDEDYEKAEKVCTSTNLYKQAGNSIVVQVLEAIFKEMM